MYGNDILVCWAFRQTEQHTPLVDGLEVKHGTSKCFHFILSGVKAAASVVADGREAGDV